MVWVRRNSLSVVDLFFLKPDCSLFNILLVSAQWYICVVIILERWLINEMGLVGWVRLWFVRFVE